MKPHAKKLSTLVRNDDLTPPRKSCPREPRFILSDILSEVSPGGRSRGQMPRRIGGDKIKKESGTEEEQGGTSINDRGGGSGGAKRRKRKWTSLSGRLCVQVGRERASSRRLAENTGCLSLIKISRNSSATRRKFRGRSARPASPLLVTALSAQNS